MIVLDGEGLIRFVNERARSLLAADNRVGLPFDALFTPLDRQRADGYVAGLVRATPDASTFFTGELAPVTGEPVRFVHVYGRHLRLTTEARDLLLLTLIDSTQARKREADLERQALYDSLTGLANRALLLERLRQVCGEDSLSGALMMVDMDGFKRVNDLLGHPAGDTLLAEVARRLRRALPASATIARLGGDEFAVLLPESDTEVATKLAADVRTDIGQPFPGVAHPVTASIGVTEVFAVESALRQADLAMYAVKATGGDGVVAYHPDLEHSQQERPSHGAESVGALLAERDRLHIEARTDALTGLPNRRALDEYVASYGGLPASVLFIDLDRFGSYNHRRGDQQGDQALAAVARTLAGGCRESDRVFRKGGEEFVAVLPEADDTAARATAERVRAAVEGLGIEHGGAPDVPILTVTVGVATRCNGDLAEGLRTAAEAAYAAKVAGLRNRVTVNGA